jgi:predicted kinase
MKNKVIILRGPSGSGKTSYQKKYHNEHWICSADDYFYDLQTNEYEFDPSKLPLAHNRCMGVFLEGLKQKAPVIVVDNTNIQRWEWENYRLIADLMGYEVEIIEFMPTTISDIKVIAARNAHGVPLSVIASQVLRFEVSNRPNTSSWPCGTR